MNEGLKVCGWALNSEYFTTIMHLLREDASYRAIVDQLIENEKGADTRSTEAVKRIATAYLKLLFPNVRSPRDISARDFMNYCLRPAIKMRKIIMTQLAMMNSQYKDKAFPIFSIREYNEEEN